MLRIILDICTNANKKHKTISIWKTLRTLMTIGGLVLMFLAVSTSDYYVLELGCSEPAYVWNYMLVGALMFAPALIHSIYELWLEGKDEE